MNLDDIPKYAGKPILDETPRQAFRLSPEEITVSIQQQFTQKELALRELGQNSQDAGATSILVRYQYEAECMTLEFLDDGCGMSRDVIMKNYLRLFNSSKEQQKGKVGKWSLGRLSLLCYAPRRIEVYTHSLGHSPYKVVIEADLSGMLYEIDPEEAERVLGGPHGTLVRMMVRMASEEEFVKEVEKANQCIEKELAWITPDLTVTTVKLTDGKLDYGSRRINRPMQVPGRYSTNLSVRMSSGSGQVDCAIGLQSKESPGLAPITLCSGKIPIERPSGLPWTGGEDFTLRNMHIIMESFDFQTNIGRNVIYRETAFMEELLPKFFQKVVLERFVKTMAKLYSQPAFRAPDYEDSLRSLLADVCIKAEVNNFEIPQEVLEAPFIQSYVSFRPYSPAELDGAKGVIYYTFERPTVLSTKDLEGQNADLICVCLADLPWEFRKFLEKRYEEKLKQKESSLFVVDIETEELSELGRWIEQRLGRVRLWVDNLFGSLDAGSEHLRFQSEIAVGRFMRFDGAPEMRTPTLYLKSSSRIYLNYNSQHIRNLVNLMSREDELYADLGAHFLMREIFFDPGLDLTISQREQLLTQDLKQRFVTGSSGFPVREEDLDDLTRELLIEFFETGALNV